MKPEGFFKGERLPMNRCHEIRKQLEHHLDAGSWDKCPEIIRRHIEKCPDCLGYWEQLQATEKTMRKAAVAPSISSIAHQRILEALRRESVPRESFQRRNTWFGVRVAWFAAAAILIVVVGVFRLPLHLTKSTHVPKHEPTAIVSVQQNLPLLTSPATLVNLLRPPSVVLAAREDFSWLAQVIISEPQSAVRAFYVQPITARRSPAPTPDS
jgi:hypothetical protein